jgi:CRISPR type I-E-associated protein CasB/Cse2
MGDIEMIPKKSRETAQTARKKFEEKETSPAFYGILRKSYDDNIFDIPELWHVAAAFKDDDRAVEAVGTAMLAYAWGPENGALSFGKALKALKEKNPKMKDMIHTRIGYLLKAGSQDRKRKELKGIVTLLKNHKIPLDYAKLSGDLYALSYDVMNTVISRSWGRDMWL